tara:strand:- start:211 stop:561 length:351 start_codon:yes stop_codon:yes gene_type:complete
MSELWVTSVYNQEGDGAPNLPKGAVVTGVATATSFEGDLTGTASLASNLTGTPNITVGTISASGNVSIGGTLTYEDVTNIDSVGIITARQGINITSGGIRGYSIKCSVWNDCNLYC